MFKVVREPVRTLWVPADTTSTPTFYKGQLVIVSGDGVKPLAVASGAADTSQLQSLFGVVVGFNRRTPQYDTVGEYDTAVITQAAQLAREFTGVEGFYPKSDPQVMLQIDIIDARTVLEGTYGAAPTVLTSTTASTDGLGFTSNAAQFTPVADYATTYCRGGANMGIMRISDDISTTVTTNDLAFPYDIAIGDTFVRVPQKPVGLSRMQTNSTATAIDGTVSPATNYFAIDVIGLDLKNAGNEKIYFRFHSVHFDGFRA